MEAGIYIVSLILQVSGALLLIVNWWKDMPTLIKYEYYKPSGAILRRNLNAQELEVMVNKERLRNALSNVYSNRVAFIYISSGYLLNVLGSPSKNKWYMFICILVFSAVLTWVTNLAIQKMAKNRSQKEKYIVMVKENIPEDTISVKIRETE